MADRYDLTVLGGGPGGYVAAIRGAQLGLRVALVEKGDLGGVCLNWGCIPTKVLLRSAAVLTTCRGAEEFGVSAGPATFRLDAMFDRKDSIVAKLRGEVEKLLKRRDVEVVRGEGVLRAPGAVEVAGSDGRRTIESDRVIVATGSKPLVPGSFPYDGRHVATSRDVLAARELPESVVVVGAGAVGCEFAGLYAALGLRVTLVEMLPEILPGEDASAARLLRTAFKRQGVDVRAGTKVQGIDIGQGGKVTVSLEGGDAVETGLVLLAMGRRPVSAEAGLAELGVAVERGAVQVNDRLETSVDGMYAIGDLVGGWLLAHVASREGIVAASQAAGKDVRMDYRAVPRCTFTRPEIASVGLTEAEAKESGLAIDVGRFPMAASGKANAEGEVLGFTKVLSDASTGRVVGGVIAGPHASDLIHEIALAVEVGVDVDRLGNMIHAHPTLAETVMEASEAVRGLSVHSL
jgi:dihydrolipoamide dehydrogenase